MFHSPWYFLLLLALPWLAWRLWSPRAKSAVRFSSLNLLRELTPSFRQRLMWLPSALTLAAIVVLIVALARPREGRNQTIVASEGIAIEMVVDRSGSMQAMDFQIDREHVDRLTAIKKVASEFVLGDVQNQELKGRFNDLVGLITFAGYADSETPPTHDHAFLVSQLNRANIVSTKGEDGTAIGDAISLAVEKLNEVGTKEKQKVKSKVIILLTDGENTAGEIEPISGAELARTLGIKVYTIGVGTKGEAPMPMIDALGRKVIGRVRVNIDEDTLRKIADVTGGKYFRATDTNSLKEIYAEIDQLEKTKIESQNFTDYRELAVQPYNRLPPILLIAFGLLAARVLLEQTWLRELV